MRVAVFCLSLLLAGCANGQPGASVPAASAPAEVVTACKVDTDCAVKNVGSCCGYHPACVAKDSPTFPERVKADCEAKGISSICGFQEPAGCACVEGRCESTGASAAGNGELQ